MNKTVKFFLSGFLLVVAYVFDGMAMNFPSIPINLPSSVFAKRIPFFRTLTAEITMNEMVKSKDVNDIKLKTRKWVAEILPGDTVALDSAGAWGFADNEQGSFLCMLAFYVFNQRFYISSENKPYYYALLSSVYDALLLERPDYYSQALFDVTTKGRDFVGIGGWIESVLYRFPQAFLLFQETVGLWFTSDRKKALEKFDEEIRVALKNSELAVYNLLQKKDQNLINTWVFYAPDFSSQDIKTLLNLSISLGNFVLFQYLVNRFYPGFIKADDIIKSLNACIDNDNQLAHFFGCLAQSSHGFFENDVEVNDLKILDQKYLTTSSNKKMTAFVCAFFDQLIDLMNTTVTKNLMNLDEKVVLDFYRGCGEAFLKNARIDKSLLMALGEFYYFVDGKKDLKGREIICRVLNDLFWTADRIIKNKETQFEQLKMRFESNGSDENYRSFLKLDDLRAMLSIDSAATKVFINKMIANDKLLNKKLSKSWLEDPDANFLVFSVCSGFKECATALFEANSDNWLSSKSALDIFDVLIGSAVRCGDVADVRILVKALTESVEVSKIKKGLWGMWWNGKYVSDNTFLHTLLMKIYEFSSVGPSNYILLQALIDNIVDYVKQDCPELFSQKNSAGEMVKDSADYGVVNFRNNTEIKKIFRYATYAIKNAQQQNKSSHPSRCIGILLDADFNGLLTGKDSVFIQLLAFLKAAACPIITLKHCLRNILKSEGMIDEKTWIVKEAGDEVVILIPRFYAGIQELSSYDLSKLPLSATAPVTELEKKLGIKIDHMRSLKAVDFEKLKYRTFSVDKYKTAFPKACIGLFVDRAEYGEETTPRFTFLISGHGSSAHGSSGENSQPYEKMLNGKVSVLSTGVITTLPHDSFVALLRGLSDKTYTHSVFLASCSFPGLTFSEIFLNGKGEKSAYPYTLVNGTLTCSRFTNPINAVDPKSFIEASSSSSPDLLDLSCCIYCSEVDLNNIPAVCYPHTMEIEPLEQGVTLVVSGDEGEVQKGGSNTLLKYVLLRSRVVKKLSFDHKVCPRIISDIPGGAVHYLEEMHTPSLSVNAVIAAFLSGSIAETKAFVVKKLLCDRWSSCKGTCELYILRAYSDVDQSEKKSALLLEKDEEGGGGAFERDGVGFVKISHEDFLLKLKTYNRAIKDIKRRMILSATHVDNSKKSSKYKTINDEYLSRFNKVKDLGDPLHFLKLSTLIKTEKQLGEKRTLLGESLGIEDGALLARFCINAKRYQMAHRLINSLINTYFLADTHKTFVVLFDLLTLLDSEADIEWATTVVLKKIYEVLKKVSTKNTKPLFALYELINYIKARGHCLGGNYLYSRYKVFVETFIKELALLDPAEFSSSNGGVTAVEYAEQQLRELEKQINVSKAEELFKLICDLCKKNATAKKPA
ncbi:TPA: hypothetical protein DDZ86_01505 [Candidatus Dependentiae bacterium]|nr:MAG: hypothetical protein UW09_C0001G0336 [candidate division TM6 bacterium GW2011_GWF2_43_87]HBL98300.1 hypothetical protein [Candidatus Dependentiae bacterium]